jgi:hypothetical protein
MSISTDLDSDPAARLAAVQVPFSNLRQDANPILATHMLQEMYRMVTQWQQELQQIAQRTIEINTSGPILAAWLESRSFKPSQVTGKTIPTPYVAVDVERLTEIDPEAGYRLCGLDEYGQLWTRPCAMAEILSVSQAIARYQQIKDLTARKQKIELHIRQILEDLVHLRMKLED